MGDGDIPEVDVDVKISLCKKYIKNYELLTGLSFDIDTITEQVHPVARIKEKLIELGYLKQ